MNYESNFSADRDTVFVEGRPSRRKWIIIAAVALAVVLAGLWFAFGRGADAPAAGAANANSDAPTVTVSVPGRQTVQRTVSATGTIAARREMPVGVAGEGGLVTRVLVEPGSWISAGQVLATVDRSVQAQTAAQLAASINVARADAKLAQSELDRAQTLVERGFISQADIDRKTATRDAALARVRVAEAQLAETRARNSRLDIRSPAAGLVLTRDVEPGQIVSAGSGVLFRVAMGGQMELLARLSESDLAAMPVGAQATVTPVGSGQSFKGEVWQVSPVINPETRQGVARIALSYDPELRPGGFASADIVAGARVAPVLPESAILSDERGSYVYIVGRDNKVARRPITTGTVTSQGIAITDGLSGNEQVVLRAGGFLNPGETVKPKRAGGNG
ncbi:efflux RND transporter periplasmic adaptor subunit [Sphingomonas gilva]|uniref:Efflux RND transporter periplasmic adaptor subunit n=1 Tax=Sphingomonas gilva TaxID=2305907 RepID=A0A396RKS7_9SPHN|nr:efflux RND transporter periplasmic adaptor subunit [Sphingomonas gilva]RHW16830.1 efflux RND transporter periplasmic adaptor subunit [Sphingomonas gilva]